MKRLDMAAPPDGAPVLELFPYLLTRVVPALYHVILMPGDASRDDLCSLSVMQAVRNRLECCLVLAASDCFYLTLAGGLCPALHPPGGGSLVSGKLAPPVEFRLTHELAARRQRLTAIVAQAASEGGFLLGDLTKGGRPATAGEARLLTGRQANGVPVGLCRCVSCGQCRGECLDPQPQFAGLLMRVHCRCENDNRCARCAELLYEWKLNSNYYDARDDTIWHVPAFCGFSHRCGDLADMEESRR